MVPFSTAEPTAMWDPHAVMDGSLPPADGNYRIFLGAQFHSYDEFMYHFNKWSVENGYRFVKSHSQTVDKANQITQRENTLASRMKYRNVVFRCIHGGTPRRSQNPVIRPGLPARRSLKSGCPALVNLTADRKIGKLVVRRLENTHNHLPSKVFHQKRIKLSNENLSYCRETPSLLQTPSELTSKPGCSGASDNATNDTCDTPTIIKVQSVSISPVPFLRPTDARSSDAGSSDQEETYPVLKANAVDESPIARVAPSPLAAEGCSRRTLLLHPKRKILSPIKTGLTDSKPPSANRLLRISEEGGSMDEIDHFCKGLAIQLHGMDEEMRSRVQVQILLLTHNARFPDNSM